MTHMLLTRRKSLRLKYIEKVEDIGDAIELCNEYDVPDAGLETVDEYKERLMTHYIVGKYGNVFETIGKAMLEAGEEDQKKRMRLVQMFEALTAIISAKDETKKTQLVEEFLSLDGTTQHIADDCLARVRDLQHGDCVILVAGESSAGKSSVLNLLFGEEILPVYAGSCTSTITTVRYGKKRSAKILFQDDTPTEIIDNLEGEGLKRFHDIAFMKGSEREDGHEIKEIQLFLPLWFLKTGLVLADTPGIGENEFLEKYLLQYISNNQILGFIYIVMSDANGGIQEDRLLLLLKMIIEEQKKSDKTLTFDPRAALFVCNRFDAIPADDRPVVKKHILTKLQTFWPEFDPSHCVFFSAKKAQRDIDAHPDYINAEYKTLLEGIQTLFSLSMERRIRSSYKWIERVLQRTFHYLKSTVGRLDMSERDRRDRSQKLKARLRKLKTDTDTVIAELRAELQLTITRFSENVRKYLQTPAVEFRLCSAWRDGEIPQLTESVKNIEHWEWVKERVDTAFYDRVCHLLEEWGEEDCNIDAIETSVVTEVRLKLGVLEEEVIEVESDMRHKSDSINSTDSGGSKNKLYLRRISMAEHRNHLLDVPIRFSNRVMTRVKPEGIMGKLTNRKDKNAYHKNPQDWAKKRARKLLKKLADSKKKDHEDILEELIRQLMQRPIEFIKKVEERIPNIIDANVQLLETMETTCLTERKYLANYEKMMEDTESLRRVLMNYGEGYIFVNDFKSNEIKITYDIKSGQSLQKTFHPTFTKDSSDSNFQKSQILPRGLWTMVYPGSLKENGKETAISIKFYLPSSGIENTFQEVAKLRCLIHHDMPLAEFLGIHHADAPIPAFIFRGLLRPMQYFMYHCSSPETHVARILNETAQGLKYIHSKGMVHMELTSTTITVNESGSVCLTGACMPRRATLPMDTDNIVAEFVFLSPQVLRDELYITTSDVYSFGLLVYELVCEKKPYHAQRKFSFKEFVEKVDPETMLLLNSDAKTWFTPQALDLIKNCVSMGYRSNMEDIIVLLGEIDGNFKKKQVPFSRSSSQASVSDVFKKSFSKDKLYVH